MEFSDFFVEYEDAIYLVVISILVVAFFLLLLYTTFFLAIIYGAAEEKDEIYDLLRIGIVRYKGGRWFINLGNLFDENAVIKVNFGWVYLKLFEGWEVDGISSGAKHGKVISKASKSTIFLKRKVRRS